MIANILVSAAISLAVGVAATLITHFIIWNWRHRLELTVKVIPPADPSDHSQKPYLFLHLANSTIIPARVHKVEIYCRRLWHPFKTRQMLQAAYFPTREEKFPTHTVFTAEVPLLPGDAAEIAYQYDPICAVARTFMGKGAKVRLCVRLHFLVQRSKRECITIRAEC